MAPSDGLLIPGVCEDFENTLDFVYSLQDGTVSTGPCAQSK